MATSGSSGLQESNRVQSLYAGHVCLCFSLDLSSPLIVCLLACLLAFAMICSSLSLSPSLPLSLSLSFSASLFALWTATACLNRLQSFGQAEAASSLASPRPTWKCAARPGSWRPRVDSSHFPSFSFCFGVGTVFGEGFFVLGVGTVFG